MDEGDAQIPPRVRELLLEKVRSIEELEILLWLRVQSAAHSEAAIARELKLTVSVVSEALERLLINQMIELRPSVDGVRHYGPYAAASNAVTELAGTYEKFRVETLVLISGNAIRRVRSGALQTFSEAFRLKGGKKDG